MFKAILCLIIIFASGGLGILKAQSYRQRLDELTEFSDMMRMLQTEMSYRKDPLPAVFARISEYKDNRAMDLLATCSLSMKESLDLHQCWEHALRRAYRGSCLKETDLQIIKDIGLQIGKSDIRGQAAMFSLIEAKLSAQTEEAAKEHETKGKMYRGLGFSIGIVVSVILI